MTLKDETTLHLTDAHCADLVLGLLADDACARALTHASACVVCAERLRSHVAAVTRLRADQSDASGAQVLRLPRRWRLGPRVPAIAAAAALVLLLGWPRFSQHVPRPQPTWLAVPSDDVLLREGDAEDPHLAAGFAAYARHDLPTAKRELMLAHTTESTEQARRLYLAHVCLLEGDAAESLSLLRSLTWIALPAAVHRDALSLLVQALRATDHRASADSLEHVLRSTPEWVPLQP